MKGRERSIRNAQSLQPGEEEKRPDLLRLDQTREREKKKKGGGGPDPYQVPRKLPNLPIISPPNNCHDHCLITRKRRKGGKRYLRATIAIYRERGEGGEGPKKSSWVERLFYEPGRKGGKRIRPSNH